MYPLATIAAYGQPHRCFDHIVLATPGLLLAVPVINIDGCIKHLPVTCPVPWHEMWSTLDIETTDTATFDTASFVPPLITELGIAADEFRVATLPEYAATVFAHPNGLRLGISNDCVHKVTA